MSLFNTHLEACYLLCLVSEPSVIVFISKNCLLSHPSVHQITSFQKSQNSSGRNMSPCVASRGYLSQPLVVNCLYKHDRRYGLCKILSEFLLSCLGLRLSFSVKIHWQLSIFLQQKPLHTEAQTLTFNSGIVQCYLAQVFLICFLVLY